MNVGQWYGMKEFGFLMPTASIDVARIPVVTIAPVQTVDLGDRIERLLASHGTMRIGEISDSVMRSPNHVRVTLKSMQCVIREGTGSRQRYRLRTSADE